MKVFYDGSVVFTISGNISKNEAASELAGSFENFDPELVSLVPETEDETRHVIRMAIAQAAGDQQSLLGTTSDAIGLLFYEVAKLAIALKDQNSLSAIRDAATPLADMMAPVIARVEAGDTLLTHQVKGEANVIEEMEQRATQVATVLQSVQSA